MKVKLILHTLFLFFFFMAIPCNAQALKEGDKLPDIKVSVLKGNNAVSSSILKLTKNKIVIIEFWETWCGPCIMAMPHLQELARKYANDLVVLAVAQDNILKTSKFINENKYPFHFIFDQKKEMNVFFPHGSIPHTILVDKQGIVRNITSPGFITNQVIDNLLGNSSTSLPSKLATNMQDAGAAGKSNLFTFNISRSGLGDLNFSSLGETTRQYNYVYGYKAGMYKDTTEHVCNMTLMHKNILEIYQVAYDNMPESRIVYPAKVQAINSRLPHHLYNVEFAVSDHFGSNMKQLFRKQLDFAFNLNSKFEKRDTAVLILKEIIPNSKTIKRYSEENSSRFPSDVVSSSSSSIEMKFNKTESTRLAKIVENHLHLPVIASPQDGNYTIDIFIDDKGDHTSKSLDEWIALYKELGIILEKCRASVDYLVIGE